MDGFGAALVDWMAMRLAIAAGCVAAVCVIIGIWCGWLMFSAAPPKPEPPTPIVADWDAWIIEHRKTCPTCQRAWDTADSAMCEEAFAKAIEDWAAKAREKLEALK